MEVPTIVMEESKKIEEAKLTSVAAFVEGGIQDACDDACSICLEEFCESEPSSVTGCKHEFHLQCILEWCQRSSQCPMCWQPISLKDPTSQELLDAVVEERNLRLNPPRNSTIFHHPALGDFEIQHLSGDLHEAELEERILQQLAAATAMGRARHFARREGHRGRSSAQSRPQFVVFSAHPDSQAGAVSFPDGEQAVTSSSSVVVPSSLIIGGEGSQYMSSSSGFNAHSSGPFASPSSSGSPNSSSPRSQDSAGPSDLQSFSEALKSRLNAMSTRYKESISNSTRGWKERWFSRNSPASYIGSEVRREVDAEIATVSRVMERLDTRDNGPPSCDLLTNSSESSPPPAPGTRHGTDSLPSMEENHTSDNRSQSPSATVSASDCV
ncbi:hypothetical protein vseg_004187 [Gypsophila vaccaria]